MRLIMGSPFPWCDVTETNPITEIRPATPTRCQNHLPAPPPVWELCSPRALGAVFPAEPISSARVSPALSGVCLEGAGLSGCQLGRSRGAGRAWHGTAWRGGAGQPGAVRSVSGCLSAALQRHRSALWAVPRERLKMHGPM